MARFGLSLLGSLAAYFLTVLGSLALFQVFGFALVLHFVARRNPWAFFKATRTVMITAFSTSSSNATFPTTLAVAQQELGIPKDIAAFVLGIGATTGQMGTALFEGASALFLAQVFGIHLGLWQQVVVVAMAVFTSIGVAGIPGGSIPLLMVVLGMVGIPMEGIAIILGIDRILDMSRTVLNVTGDLVTAAIVVRVEGN
jgi:DAACS family dicarboxylate/amino acid:cation (Na+ or H+) symporter